MADRQADLRLDAAPAVAHLCAPDVVRVLRQHRVRERMGADGAERMLGQRPDGVPVKAEALGQGRGFDAGAPRQGVDDVEEPVFRPRAKHPVQRVERRRLLLGAAGGQAERRSGEFDLDAIGRADRLLQLQPPEARRAIGEAGRHIGGERGLMPLQDRQRVLDEIAVAVVERQRDERPIRRLDDAPQRLVQAHDVEAKRLDATERAIEKRRLDLQQAVRRKPVRPARAHVVKHQDGTASARQRRQAAMQARRPEEGEAGPDDLLLQRTQSQPPNAFLTKSRKGALSFRC